MFYFQCTDGDFKLLIPGEPNMSERIVLALKLSSIVHGPSTGDLVRREALATAWDSDVGPDHELYKKSSHCFERQEVCENSTSSYVYTSPGNCVFTHACIVICKICSIRISSYSHRVS